MGMASLQKQPMRSLIWRPSVFCLHAPRGGWWALGGPSPDGSCDQPATKGPGAFPHPDGTAVKPALSAGTHVPSWREKTWRGAGGDKPSMRGERSAIVERLVSPPDLTKPQGTCCVRGQAATMSWKDAVLASDWLVFGRTTLSPACPGSPASDAFTSLVQQAAPAGASFLISSFHFFLWGLGITVAISDAWVVLFWYSETVSPGQPTPWTHYCSYFCNVVPLGYSFSVCAAPSPEKGASLYLGFIQYNCSCASLFPVLTDEKNT